MKMIDRSCKCGCGMMFRCLENSGQRYYSKMHVYWEAAKKSKSKKSDYRRGFNSETDDWRFGNKTRPESKSKENDELKSIEPEHQLQ